MINLQPNGSEIAKPGVRHYLLRVKCGNTDFFAIGEVDVRAMHQFHGRQRSPAKPLKPVPSGFKTDFGRNVSPLGENG